MNDMPNHARAFGGGAAAVWDVRLLVRDGCRRRWCAGGAGWSFTKQVHIQPIGKLLIHLLTVVVKWRL